MAKGKGKGKKGKGKGGKGKKGGPKEPKKKLPKVTDCLTTPEMSKNQLLGFITRLLKEVDQELLERNLFMLEKSKLWSLWQLTIDKVSQLREEVRNAQTKIDKSEKEKESEKEVYNKKLRYLQNEEIKNFGIIRLNHLHYMRKLSNEIWEMEILLRENAFAKKKDIRKTMGSYYEILRGLRFSHAKSITDMLTTLSEAMHSFEKLEDRKYFGRKNTWEEAYLPYFELLRSSKVSTMDTMFQAHDRNLLEMKSFFDDVMTNNLALMTMLAEEIDAQKLHENRLKRDLRWAKEKYYGIHDPLQDMLKNFAIWNESNKSAVELMRRLSGNEKVLKSKTHCGHVLEITIECLREQISIAIVERDKARIEFGRTVRKMQRQVQMKTLVHQLKSKAATKDTMLFQSMSSHIREPFHSSYNHYEKLRRRKEYQKRTYKDAANLISDDLEGMEGSLRKCLDKQRTVDVGAVGLVNNVRTIHKPWREIYPIDYGKCTDTRKHQVLSAQYIFHQDPPLRKRYFSGEPEAESQTSRNSSASSNVVRLMLPKSLNNIKSKSTLPDEVLGAYEPTTQMKLDRLIQKTEFRLKDPPPIDCELNTMHGPPPLGVEFPILKLPPRVKQFRSECVKRHR